MNKLVQILQRPTLQVLFVTVIIASLSCGGGRSGPQMQAGTGLYIAAHDSVRISYTDSGRGDTVLLFIHGWGIDKTYWRSQVHYFSRRYRVVTVDLPGFGSSGKNRNSWTVEDYARDMNAVISALSLKRVLLIGHSMSGAIIVETAIRYPRHIIGVVGVDNLKNIGMVVTPETEKEWSVFYSAARAHFTQTISNDIASLFSPYTDDSIKQKVTQDILSSDSLIAVACLENLDRYPFSQQLKLLNKPLSLVNSSCQPTDTITFRKNSIPYQLLSIDSTGHYPMIERPDAFNRLLEYVVIRSK